ncbi:hypothetical protein LRP67_16595 [Nocardioides sp. cx-169]|uniref:hypothetical protein n=1 Tax=Nocardioides sp. cx-169 TaxID=2899080 RepID=UPI001E5C76BC|nr:hypothetical protein [Nocardioides sp. cx-169]MCD4535711.1 hypothetical protein [Nocardioides sp. cx-169]
MSIDHWESEVRRELGDRVQGLDDAPFSLDQVKDRASRLRRTRRRAAAGSVLAVAAVVVPLAVAGQGLAGRTDRDLPPANQSADPTPLPSEGVDTGGSGLGVDYLDGRTWVRSEAPPVQLPAAYSFGVVLDGQLVGARNDDDTGIDVLELVDEDGEVTHTVRGVLSGPVANEQSTAIAYLTTAGELVVRSDGQSRAVARGLETDLSPTALVGDCGRDDTGCRLYLNDGSGGPAQVLGADGSLRDAVDADPAPTDVEDAAEDGTVAVQLSSDGAEACYALYDSATTGYTYDTCAYSLLDLDPTGDLVAVSEAYYDGLGRSYVGIIGEGGELAARLDPDGVVVDEDWADDGSLVATVFEREPGAWSIWRLSADGTVEKVVAGGPDTEDVSGYLLLG